MISDLELRSWVKRCGMHFVTPTKLKKLNNHTKTKKKRLYSAEIEISGLLTSQLVTESMAGFTAGVMSPSFSKILSSCMTWLIRNRAAHTPKDNDQEAPTSHFINLPRSVALNP